MPSRLSSNPTHADGFAHHTRRRAANKAFGTNALSRGVNGGKAGARPAWCRKEVTQAWVILGVDAPLSMVGERVKTGGWFGPEKAHADSQPRHLGHPVQLPYLISPIQTFARRSVALGEPGNPCSVSGTIGQADAGTMSGGSYSLRGGFWSIIDAVQTSGAPLLQIINTGTNAVAAVWPPTRTGLDCSTRRKAPGFLASSRRRASVRGCDPPGERKENPFPQSGNIHSDCPALPPGQVLTPRAILRCLTCPGERVREKRSLGGCTWAARRRPTGAYTATCAGTEPPARARANWRYDKGAARNDPSHGLAPLSVLYPHDRTAGSRSPVRGWGVRRVF